jgi:hypothetical protein
MSRPTLAGLFGMLLALAVVVWTVQSLQPPPRPDAVAALGELADPNEVYDPVRAGEPLPEGHRQLLPRDGILPVYDPQFVSPEESGWSDAALVIGVEFAGKAKAYPVSFLNRREMVVDRLAGIPILVTW